METEEHLDRFGFILLTTSFHGEHFQETFSFLCPFHLPVALSCYQEYSGINQGYGLVCLLERMHITSPFSSKEKLHCFLH